MLRCCFLSAVAAVLAAVAPLAAARQAGRSPEELARALERRYATVRDFRADFTQVFRGGVLRTESRERGTFAIKKPGMVRWSYTDPDRKEVGSDGTQQYFYVVEDRHARLRPVPQGHQASTADLFLSGRGDIATDFTPAIVDSPVSGTVGLELTPVRREAEFERLVLALDPETLQIRGLTTFDPQGGQTTIRFENLKENTGIDDGYFTLQLPRGVDVQVD